MRIFCCSCWKTVNAVFVSGRSIYPHLPELANKKFYQCPTCKNYVGVHKGTERPLGTISTPELRELRRRVHAKLDPIWRSGKISREALYAKIADRIGQGHFHTAEINNFATGKLVLKILDEIKVKYNL